MIFWRVAVPFIAGYYVSYVYRMVNAVLAPTLAVEFGLSAGGLGLLSSVYFFAFALVQLPIGVLFDRFGPRRVNALLMLLAVAGGTWFAHAESAGAAIAARALIGIGVSGCLMASFTAFVLWYPPERIATMNAIAFSAGAVGAMTATVPLEMLLRVWPWRDAFMLIVAATLLVSLVLWFWVPEKPVARRDDWASQWRGLVKLLVDPAFLRIAVCLGASQFAAVALQTLWIATWLRDVAGYDPAGVARGLLAVNVAMIVGYGIVAFRDPNGIRPLVLGRRDTDRGPEYMVASESVALDALRFKRMRLPMKPNSRSPCADWFRFMKSMSMVDQGISWLNWVCR